MSQLHEEELDRFIDQHLMWSSEIPLDRLVGPYARSDVLTSEFFRSGSPRFYKIGRSGSGLPIFVGVTPNGMSVAGYLADQLANGSRGSSPAAARRLGDALRHARRDQVHVAQLPLRHVGIDARDRLAVRSALLVLQSRRGTQVVIGGDQETSPLGAQAESTFGGEAMETGKTIKDALTGVALMAGTLLAPPGPTGDVIRDPVEAVSETEKRRAENREVGRSAQDPVGHPSQRPLPRRKASSSPKRMRIRVPLQRDPTGGWRRP